MTIFRRQTAVTTAVTRALAPVLHLDLLQPHGQQLLWDMLQRPGVAFVHLGPPCGTSSRAREINNGGPPPLCTEHRPDGRPHLSGSDLARVQAANSLYALTGQVMSFCCRSGILCTIENPLRSLAWLTSHLKRPLAPWAHQLVSVQLHACMFGSTRRKATKLLANHPGFLRLQPARVDRPCREQRLHQEHRLQWNMSLRI